MEADVNMLKRNTIRRIPEANLDNSLTICRKVEHIDNTFARAAIVLQTGAELKGRALAQTEVTLDSNPIVVSEFPAILILPLFMIATLLAVIVYKKRNLGYTKTVRVLS